MAQDRKTLAIMLGAAAGVTVVSLAVVWYMKAHADAHPVQDVHEAISRAYDKIREIESIATSRIEKAS